MGFAISTKGLRLIGLILKSGYVVSKLGVIFKAKAESKDKLPVNSRSKVLRYSYI